MIYRNLTSTFPPPPSSLFPSLASLPLWAFVFCITYSFFYHHDWVTRTHCNVWNVAPSISGNETRGCLFVNHLLRSQIISKDNWYERKEFIQWKYQSSVYTLVILINWQYGISLLGDWIKCSQISDNWNLVGCTVYSVHCTVVHLALSLRLFAVPSKQYRS